MSDYIPYGPEWEKEMMKFSKIDLIRMFATSQKKLDAAKSTTGTGARSKELLADFE